MFQKHSNDLRLGFIFNSAAPSAGKVDVNKAFYVAVKTLPNNLAKNFVTKLAKDENFEALQSGEKTLKDLEVNVSDFKLLLNLNVRIVIYKLVNCHMSAKQLYLVHYLH